MGAAPCTNIEVFTAGNHSWFSDHVVSVISLTNLRWLQALS